MLEYFEPHTAARSLKEGDSTQHGEYELRYDTIDTGASKPQHIIEAHHPEDGRVGFMRWMGTAPHAIDRVEVNSDHQRQGLATAMWNWAQENARPKPRHSNQRTPQGDAWARSVGGTLPRKKATLSREPGPVTFPYLRNTEPAPDLGEMYGQHIEPHGRYIRHHTGPRPEGDRWETGEASFENPLHMDYGSPANTIGNWKHRLSEQFGGRKGKALSRAVVKAGHDAIITHDEYGPNEIVDLTSFKKTAEREPGPLPDRLYHVTTAVTPALEHGLKTRDELGQRRGHGLGGGRSDTISLTTHKPTAEHLLHSLHEYHDVLHGKITPDDLIEKAKKGVGAAKPYDDFIRGGNEYYERAKDLEGDRTHARGVHVLGEQPEGWEPKGESIGQHKDSGKPIHMEWTRPVDPEERIHARSDLYKHFTWGRQFAGGHMDPLFVQNDPVEFAKKDPGEFSLLHVRPKPGAQGIRMNDREHGTDAGEWRALSGKDLDVVYNEGREHIEPREAAHDPHAHVRWGDGTYRSFRNAWGASRGNSYMISGASAHLMGLKGYDHDDQEYMSGTEKERLALAHHALHTIHKSKGVDEEIYHGTVNPIAKALREGDEVKLPLTAASGSRTLAEGFARGRDEAGSILHFPKGTPFYPQDEHPASDRKEYELDHRWSEAITAGHFKVKHRYEEDDGTTHVHLEHQAMFNPHTKSWERAGTKTAAGPCGCCGGIGEHGAIECYACDSSGTQDIFEEGTRCRRECPCGATAEYDLADGWQHLDGSVSHDGEHYGKSVSELMSHPPQRIAAHPTPTSRVFGPTFGLDHRLFVAEDLKPEVRQAVMDRLDGVLGPFVGFSWREWTKVYLAGSEASEWTSATLEGNGDFDTLIGVDYDRAREMEPGKLGNFDDDRITWAMNTALKFGYNASPWKPSFGGEWDLTGYVNPNSYDITKIKPYAAYNITDDMWAVRPPHLPDWSIDKLPEGGQNLLDEAEGYAAVVDAISKMPEPFQTQQGKALWKHLHSDRGRAFSDEGEGWLDPGNLIEKALVEWGVWDKLVEWQYGKKTASHDGLPVEHVRLDKIWPHREWDHQPGGYSYERDGGGPYAWKHNAESWERNKQSVAEGGIQNPITLEYNPKTHSAYVGEGNHRLHWARELGHETVPVRVWRTSKEMHPRYELPGEVPEHEGHIPQDMDPRSVLPEDWFPTRKTASKEYCEACGTEHEGYFDEDDHYRSRTDWDRVYDQVPQDVHRGMAVHLSPETHAKVHGDGPEHERARALLDHVTSEPLGMHWSANNPQVAASIAEDEVARMHPRERAKTTHVVLHADKPAREHVETDINRLTQGSVISYHDSPESEVPHKEGAPVNIWGVSWKKHNEPGWHYHELEHPIRRTAVKGSDHPLAPDLPQEQHDALTAEDDREYRRKTLELAKNPVSGTHIWRGEIRKGDPVQGARDTGVGMHWGVNPSNILHPYPYEADDREVVYHAELEHPGEQNYERGHPMWHGHHRSMDSEAEVRLKPGTKVKLHGVWVKDREHAERGPFVPRDPHRMGKNWTYHPIGEHITVSHRPADGLIDYSDVGIQHEGMLGYFTADYRLMHQPPDEDSGRPMHEVEGGDPDEHVRIYRSVPHEVDHFDTNTWATTNPEYAHQHGRDSHDPKKDWPVISAEVPKRHVFWDENDENEVGYQGPRLESHQIELHDEETGEHRPYEPPDEDFMKEQERGGHMYHGMGVHLPPEDHAFVHDESKPIAERAHRVFQHVPERIRQNGTPHWEPDPDDAEMDTYDEDRHVGEHKTPLTQVVVHGSQNLDHAHGISWASEDDLRRSVSFDRYHHHEFEGDPNERLAKQATVADYFGMAA